MAEGTLKNQHQVPESDGPSVPLATQQARLEAQISEGAEAVWILALKHWPTVCKLARHRLVEGYDMYGETMYQWEAEERLWNALEELADAVVYLSSGPTR